MADGKLISAAAGFEDLRKRYRRRYVVRLGSVSFELIFFFSSRRRHTRLQGDWSSDVCSSDLGVGRGLVGDFDGGQCRLGQGLRVRGRRPCGAQRAAQRRGQWMETKGVRGRAQDRKSVV